MKKGLSIILCFIMVMSLFSIIPFSASAEEADIADTSAAYTSDWQRWSQGASDYSIMRGYGCWVVAMSKMFMETGIAQSGLNPDVFYWWERNNGWLPNNDNNLNQYDGYNAPVAYANAQGKTLEAIAQNWSVNESTLWSYVNSGYYTIIQVSNFEHYVYIDNARSKSSGVIYIMESFTNTTYADSYPLYSRYSGVTRAMTYKASSAPNPDLGSGFYASISHLDSGNYITAESSGNVDICKCNNTANQYWKFYRQDDGSYKIKSASTGKCLEVGGGSSQDAANIQVYDDNNTDAQKWDLLPCGNGYQLKAKCTERVMEMQAWGFYEGVNVVSGTKDGSAAEIFGINYKDFNDIGKTSLTVSSGDGNVVFSWNNALCSTNYNIYIWKGTTVSSGEPLIHLWNVRNNSYTLPLEDGTYTAYIECYNMLWDYVNSAPVTFTVMNYSSLIPTATIEYHKTKYELYNKKLTWKLAKEICENKGGHLAVIDSSEENQVLTDLSSSLSNYVWIGGTDEGSEGNWYWVNGDSFSFTNWDSSEPSNSNGNEHFASLLGRTGKWNDAANDNQFISGFICEYEFNTILGDADGDGQVSALDTTWIQRALARQDVPETYDEAAADIDGDGKVTALDVTWLQRYLAKMDVPYEIG